MSMPNSADMDIVENNSGADTPTRSVVERAPKDKSAGSMPPKKGKEGGKTPKAGSASKNPTKTQKTTSSTGSKNSGSATNPQQPGPGTAEKFDAIERLLIQMHRESREHKQEINNRLDKLEKDYGNLNYGDEASYEGTNQFSDYGDYQSGIFGSQAGSVMAEEPEEDFQAPAHVKDLLNMTEESNVNEQNAESKDKQVSDNNTVPKPKGFSSKFADVDQLGPPVNDAIATEVDYMLSEKLQDSKITETLKQYHAPSNLKRLKSQKVNPPIWGTLSDGKKKFDMRLQRVQTSLTSGLNALVRSIGDSAVSAELENAMALLCNANYELNVARKEHIKPELNPAYHHLVKKPVGVDYLFGDDLQSYVKAITEEKKAVMVCTKPKGFGGNRGNFVGRGRRNNRVHPYNVNQNRNRPFLGRGGPMLHQYQQGQYHQQQQDPQQQGYNNRGRGRGKPPSTMTRPSQ